MLKVDAWCGHIKQNVSPETAELYSQDLTAFFQHHGRDLETVILDDLSRYLSFLSANGASDDTLLRVRSALRAFFAHAADQAWCGENPALDLLIPSGKPIIENTLSTSGEVNSEVATNAASVMGEISDIPWIQARDRALLLLMIEHDLKLSVVLAIRVEDVKGQELIIPAGLKRKESSIPLRRNVKGAIDLYLTRDPFERPVTRKLFMGAKGGDLSASVVQRQLLALRDMLHLSDSYTAETLREALAGQRKSDHRAEQVSG